MTDYKKLAYDFAHRHFGDNLECVFFSGSYAFGGAKPLSDIDLLIVCKHVPNQRFWSVHENGHHFDCKVHDPETLLFELNKQHNDTHFLMSVYLVGKSIILPEDNKVGQFFQATARKNWADGPNVSKIRLGFMRHKLKSLMNNVIDTDDADELFSVVDDCFAVLRDYLFLNAGMYLHSGVWWPRIGRVSFPNEYDEMMAAFRSYYKADGKAPLVAFMQRLLNEAGVGAEDEFIFDYPPNWRQRL